MAEPGRQIADPRVNIVIPVARIAASRHQPAISAAATAKKADFDAAVVDLKSLRRDVRRPQTTSNQPQTAEKCLRPTPISIRPIEQDTHSALTGDPPSRDEFWRFHSGRINFARAVHDTFMTLAGQIARGQQVKP